MPNDQLVSSCSLVQIPTSICILVILYVCSHNMISHKHRHILNIHLRKNLPTVDFSYRFVYSSRAQYVCLDPSWLCRIAIASYWGMQLLQKILQSLTSLTGSVRVSSLKRTWPSCLATTPTCISACWFKSSPALRSVMSSKEPTRCAITRPEPIMLA